MQLENVDLAKLIIVAIGQKKVLKCRLLQFSIALVSVSRCEKFILVLCMKFGVLGDIVRRGMFSNSIGCHKFKRCWHLDFVLLGGNGLC